ncbi:MAG: universal stress protein [Bacteroidia bacterium]|nr:universal stress protein [Bacteroidia bacterium]NND25772.1 universal stress protein [Flavobacteriaceae bacterium]MBT8277394.1 universal stress protein [Bacteroidia bacterium]NNK59698.1 universal stress protein [Flavobacteriaceae bacterium]NNL32660.1 universal stress protein [Flavobacteriaceae bacterium]
MTENKFNTIGIGVTFSPNLQANIFEASRFALFFESKLVLIHVGDYSEEKEKKFKVLLSPFIEKQLDYEIVFQSGPPVDTILSVCKSKKIDLLILGALQRESFVRYYVGSIARKITRRAKCSVLLLINPSVNRIPRQYIVTSGLDEPETPHVIETAFYVGRQLQSERLTIVEEISKQDININVDDTKALRKTTIAKERMRLREASRVKKIIDGIDSELKKNILVNSQPIFGKRGYSIGHYAQVVRADLLVMAAPKKLSFWDRLFPHDIEHILTELPTDVLIVQ